MKWGSVHHCTIHQCAIKINIERDRIFGYKCTKRWIISFHWSVYRKYGKISGIDIRKCDALARKMKIKSRNIATTRSWDFWTRSLICRSTRQYSLRKYTEPRFTSPASVFFMIFTDLSQPIAKTIHLARCNNMLLHRQEEIISQFRILFWNLLHRLFHDLFPWFFFSLQYNETAVSASYSWSERKY